MLDLGLACTSLAMKQKEGLQEGTELTRKFEFNAKYGIDNPALSLAEDSEPEGAFQVRFCFLKKEDGESFGFWLHQEVDNGAHVIRKVKPGGLAHRRGLREGDRILEVNSMCVEGMAHWKVAWKIKSSGQQLLLTILDGDTYDMTLALDRDLGLPPHDRPRLCCIAKGPHGFGFTVSAPEGVKGTFRVSVPEDGAAHKAGVPDGSWLLTLNGNSVENWTYSRLQKKLKASRSPIGLLVIDAESEEFYRQRGIKVTGAMADASRVPFKVRKLQMMKGPEGYGFLLKEEKCCSGKKGQFLQEVDVGMPAEKVGMRNGDRLLAVNGESAEDLDHQEVVLQIRAYSNWVTLLVIDAEGSKFYDLVGLSPLLFYEDQDPPSSLDIPDASSSPSTLQESNSSALPPCLCHLRRGLRGNGLQLDQSADGSQNHQDEVSEAAF